MKKFLLTIVAIEAVFSLLLASILAPSPTVQTAEFEPITGSITESATEQEAKSTTPSKNPEEHPTPTPTPVIKITTSTKIAETTTVKANSKTGEEEIERTEEYSKEIVTETIADIEHIADLQTITDAEHIADLRTITSIDHATDLLAGLIEAEAGIVKNPDEKVAVGLVALYRTKNISYPDNLDAVIAQPCQFAEPAKSYSESSYDAAARALEIYETGEKSNISEDFIYFFGDGRRNYFYNAAGEWYEFDGYPNPDNLDELLYEVQHDGL